jgi:hypothetical protein
MTDSMDEILRSLPWRCFHCDFVTNDAREAAAHFGCDDEQTICRWWASIDSNERLRETQSLARELEAERAENMRLRAHIEGLEYQVGTLVPSIQSYKPFRQCHSIYEVFCLYDTMEGRALAAEERLAVS